MLLPLSPLVLIFLMPNMLVLIAPFTLPENLTGLIGFWAVMLERSRIDIDIVLPGEINLDAGDGWTC